MAGSVRIQVVVYGNFFSELVKTHLLCGVMSRSYYYLNFNML